MNNINIIIKLLCYERIDSKRNLGFLVFIFFIIFFLFEISRYVVSLNYIIRVIIIFK